MTLQPASSRSAVDPREQPSHGVSPSGAPPGPSAPRRAAAVASDLAGWLRRITRFPTALVGSVIVIVYVFTASFGPFLAPYPYTEFHIEDALQSPSPQYPFGTDRFGRDILSRVIVGSRNILVLALSATGLGMALGIAVGLVAGYYGGLLDEALMRLMDLMMSFPSLLLALLILSTLGSALINVILGIAIVFTPRVARVVRSVVLDLKTKEFVDAAKVRGESGAYIMLREILPNATGTIVVEGSIRISYAILLGAALGFLGLGVQPPAPDWGLQVSEGRNFILAAPWVVLFPSVAIASLVIGVNLLADGLSQVLRVRARSWQAVPAPEKPEAEELAEAGPEEREVFESQVAERER